MEKSSLKSQQLIRWSPHFTETEGFTAVFSAIEPYPDKWIWYTPIKININSILHLFLYLPNLQTFCQNICMIYSIDSIDIPVTLLYLPSTVAETPWSFIEQTGHWKSSDWCHFHRVESVINNTYQLLKKHILGDPLCGSNGIKAQNHTRT